MASLNFSLLEEAMAVSRTAVRIAGEKILEVAASGNFGLELKDDQSPVGRADKLSNIELCTLLHTEFPDFGIVTEETINEADLPSSSKLNLKSFNKALAEWQTREYCWYFDPLDGTKGFPDSVYGIHVGLTKEGKPVLGINYYPKFDTLYSAITSMGAYQITDKSSAPIRVSNAQNLQDARPLLSKSHEDDIAQRFLRSEFKEATRVDSTGFKMCTVAQGGADFYINFTQNLSLWDVCSGQVVLGESRGKMTDCKGLPIDYRANSTMKLPCGIIVSNGIIHDALVEKARPFLPGQ